MVNCPSCQAENAGSALACSSCGAPLAPTAMVVTVDLAAGAVFHSRYEILGPLGRGGMGTVYKAHDRTLDENVAIKVLRPDFANDPKMAQRFKSEIKMARRVRHRNVCTIHDYGEERGLLFISMEYIDGTDLKRVVKRDGGLPWERAYDVSIQVCEGLQAVHEAGIIHRDLKTPNIMLDDQGLARLMDFGVAKQQNAAESATATGHVVGTPEYMSPEQAQGHKLDPRCDIYAMGVVIYEIFTGEVPFRGETPISTILKHLHDAPPLETPAAGKIPPALRPVVRKALSKEPEDRYGSARELAEAVRQARTPSRRQQPIATDVLEAQTLTAFQPRVKPRPMYPWLLGLLAATGAGVLALSQFMRREAPVDTAAALRTPAPSATPVPGSATPAAVETAPPETLVTAPPPPATPAPPVSVAPSAAPRPRPSERRSPAPVVAAPTPPPVAPTPTPAPAPVPAPAVPTPAPRPTETPEPEGTGLLQVAVQPWATVTVDGKRFGDTPIDKIPLDSGRHRVRLENPLWEPHESEVVIRAGQTWKLTFDFRKQGTRRKEP
jgi:serine/threonine-protein kinase